MIMRDKRFLMRLALLLLALILVVGGPAAARELGGELIIFHAGSLTVPFRRLAEIFRREHPGVKILAEAAGSRNCARKISELQRPCDVMASADYTVIEQLLIPRYADWSLSFAGNEMAIMYRPDSKFAGRINADNWPQILLREGVQYGHSDPNADPCGYRSQLVWQLAQKYYRIPGLYRQLRRKCPPRNVRPKETDLIAMLEAGELDYLFIYRSLCGQHRMPCLILPEQISLKSADYEDFYRQASVRISGKTPGSFITKTGAPMIYGVTIPRNAPNPAAATAFLELLISRQGQRVMAENGQPPIVPALVSGDRSRLPRRLRPWVREDSP